MTEKAKIYPIPPGLWCVPSAMVAITGADWMSVIQPALNRHAQARGLMDLVTGATRTAAVAALREMGWQVRLYKGEKLRAHVATWAKRSLEKYPGRTLMVSTTGHMLAIADGRVYDSWTPHGETGEEHPYAKTTVTWAALVQKGG